MFRVSGVGSDGARGGRFCAGRYLHFGVIILTNTNKIQKQTKKVPSHGRTETERQTDQPTDPPAWRQAGGRERRQARTYSVPLLLTSQVG